ncbi:Tkl protein kinase [Globisporangium polare]
MAVRNALLLAAFAGLAVSNGPTVASAQGARSSDGSTSGSSASSYSGSVDERDLYCNKDLLETYTMNTTCNQAPLFLVNNATNFELACYNANCTNLVTKIKEQNFGDCLLFNTTHLESDYILPMENYCSVNSSSSSDSRGDSISSNGTIIAGNSTASNSTAAGSLDSSSRDDARDNLNSLSTVAIIVLVLGSVCGGGLVTVLLVWLRSHRRKQKAKSEFLAAHGGSGNGRGSPGGKLGAGILTPSTEDGSGAHYTSGGDTGEPDVVGEIRPLAPGFVAASDPLALMTTGQMMMSLSTSSLGSSSGYWDDEAIIAARIPREKIKAEALISRGGFGEVYRGTYNGQQVAIKSLLPEKRKNLKQINAFLSEVKLMTFLEHAQIVTFVGVAWDSLTDLCVISEYMEGGDLRALLEKFDKVDKRPHGFDADKVRIALHIAHAMTYLHSLHPIVLHRDLKSKNILLDGKLNAKLTDFGVSRERGDGTMTAGVGTSLWMAPEVMMGERYDHRADMFSFGIVLSELDTHALPYSQVKASDSGRRLPVLQLVSLGRMKVQFSEHAPQALVDLGNACISLDPYERPTAAEAMCKLHRALKAMK